MCEKLETLCQLSCFSNYSSVKGEICVYLMSLFRLRIALPTGPGGRVPLSLTTVPRQKAQLGLSSPVFHTPFHTATHRDSQGLSVPQQPSWSSLSSPCFCRGSCVRRFRCLSPFCLCLIARCSDPSGMNPHNSDHLFSEILSVQCMILFSRCLAGCLPASYFI